MASDLTENLVIVGAIGLAVYFILRNAGPGGFGTNTGDANCTWWGQAMGFCNPDIGAGNNCTSFGQLIGACNPVGPTYRAETVYQRGPITSPTVDTGSIEGGQTIVTTTGQCQYPDGTVVNVPPNSICPLDPNHNGQSMPI